MATAKRAARSTEAKVPPDATAAAAKRGAARTHVACANGLDEDAAPRQVTLAASNAESARNARALAPKTEPVCNARASVSGADPASRPRSPVPDVGPARKATAPASEASVPAASQERGAAVSRPEYWDRACADLVRRDRILKKLIPQFGPVHLMARGDPFVTLARSIVGQQISVSAAQAIWARLVAACPSIAPSRIVKLGQPRLLECGLSKRKSEYILDLAQHFTSGALHIASWVSMDDEAVIGELTQIRGIGRWTAEMFLIFNLMRPNVLPLDDLGLIRAISVNYFSGEPVTRSEAREVAANWEPWRTVATWYMWRSLEPLSAQA
ncbi:DNA-3-methyladenine glycosylase [Mycetohabitans sp. B8]|uniref:DNA-3-methyladenine glycosylase family protein n=1 Tax=Mycetohabitans sp. B8 TaxID=2841845 RepID=UPI001F3C8398|nr:DNA-3-methyladenine glycosylase [Mycetohabitans sp. B8]